MILEFGYENLYFLKKRIKYNSNKMNSFMKKISMTNNLYYRRPNIFFSPLYLGVAI